MNFFYQLNLRSGDLQRIFFAFFLLAFVFAEPCFSQNATDSIGIKPKFKKYWSIGPAESLDWSYRKLKAENDYFNGYKTFLDSVEKPTIKFTLGLDASYQLTKNFGLTLNLSYTDKGRVSNGAIARQDPFYYGSYSTPTTYSSFKYLQVVLLPHLNFNIRNAILNIELGLAHFVLVKDREMRTLGFDLNKDGIIEKWAVVDSAFVKNYYNPTNGKGYVIRSGISKYLNNQILVSIGLSFTKFICNDHKHWDNPREWDYGEMGIYLDDCPYSMSFYTAAYFLLNN